MNYLYGLCCEWPSSFLIFFALAETISSISGLGIRVLSDILFGDPSSLRYPMPEPLIWAAPPRRLWRWGSLGRYKSARCRRRRSVVPSCTSSIPQRRPERDKAFKTVDIVFPLSIGSDSKLTKIPWTEIVSEIHYKHGAHHNAALPTLSSIVSNLVRTIPSINLGRFICKDNPFSTRWK